MLLTFVLASLMTAHSIAAFGSANCDGPFPDTDWTTIGVEDAGINPAALAKWEKYVFGDELGRRTDAALIIREGRIVFERYARGYSRKHRHNLWSVAKSLGVTLVGVAEKEGYLRRDDFAHQYYPALDEDQKRAITLEDLMQMSSGLQFNEGYVNPADSDVVSMLYTSSSMDMSGYAAAKPMTDPPGTKFQYKSGDTNILMAALKGALKGIVYSNYPWNKLFTPLGITSAVFETDGSGNFVGSSYSYMTPRDLARFGLLYSRGGCWRGDQILPENWLSFVGQLAPAFKWTEFKVWDEKRPYGAGFYLNVPVPRLGWPKLYPMAPEDLLIGLGHEGQILLVSPSLDLVVVRLGDDGPLGFSDVRFVDLLMRSLESTSAFATTQAPESQIIDAKSLLASRPSAIDVVSALSAKEFCSCHYVEQREPEFCDDKIRQWIPRGDLSWDDQTKAVESGYKKKFRAKWVDERRGCILVND